VDAEVARGLRLVADVDFGSGIVPDEDDGESGRPSGTRY
jgi:hypothetical protein